MQPDKTGPLRSALQPAALKAALKPRRPVFRDPWDSFADMFLCYSAVSVVGPWLLFCGGQIMSIVFGLQSRWPIGLFMASSVVGAAGFMTVVGRERSSLSVDIVAITAWLLLGLVVAPPLGLALPPAAALASYGAVLLAILIVVRRFGHWETDFRGTLSWPITWTLLALLFAYSWHRLVFYD